MKRITSVLLGRDVANRFEGAWARWGERSWLPSGIQEARFDADASTRLELQRKMQYWRSNSALVRKLLQISEQYVVGEGGLTVVPSSSDIEFNKAAADWFKVWCRMCGLDNPHPFWVQQVMWLDNWAIDGEIFIYKTYSRRSGRPRIQNIESYRISTPADFKKKEGNFPGFVDGVEVDDDGRPIAYWVQNRSTSPPLNFGSPMVYLNSDSYVRLDASDVVHIFLPYRPGAYRGLPWGYSCLNYLHDLDDLFIFSMKQAKANARFTNIIKNASGEADVERMRMQRFQIPTQNANQEQQIKTSNLYYQSTLGGDTLVLKPGEDITQLESARPSDSEFRFWDMLHNYICMGWGIPKLLVLPYSTQGTVTRADLDSACGAFRMRTGIIANAISQIYAWVIAWANKYDEGLAAKPPADWNEVTIRPPRAPNVDIGNNSQALIQECAAGIRTLESVIGDHGDDWREHVAQKGEEAKEIVRVAKECGVEPEMIVNLLQTPPAKPSSGKGEVPNEQMANR